MKYLSFVLLVFITLFSIRTPAAAAEDEEGILIGRIAHIEGNLLRYIEEEKDWVITVQDTPFGLDDALYSEDNARAELIMPNSTWIRIGENTQIQLITMSPDTTTLDVASGLARFYNKSRDTLNKVTTPFGYVVAPGDTIFDLYVGDESLEVIAVRGNVNFVHDATNAKYEVKEGGSSIIADKSGIDPGNGTVDAAWDDWNGQRDSLWAQRLEVTGYSADFLPEPIREESYALEENGRWERVIYDGGYRDLWRPTNVEPGWRPFTVGRWSVYYGDNCWIPDEPFGYVTHHYGSWVYVEAFRAWYWAPPVLRPIVGVPSIHISFGWYPGRVGWIYSTTSVGWVPLAPTEVYYGYRPWGHRTIVVRRSAAISINIGQYRYLDEAVIIPRDNFYRGSRYTPFLERKVNRTTIVNNYKPATVVNNTVINNFNTDRRRFAVNDAPVVRKPHSTVLSRIDANQKLGRDVNRGSRRGIEQDLTRIKTMAQPERKTDVRPPKVTTKLVEPDKVAKPLNEFTFPQKEIKPKDHERQFSPENRPSIERLRHPPGDRSQVNQGPGATDRDASRRIGSPRDTGTQRTEQAERPQVQERRQGPQGPTGQRSNDQPKSSQGVTQEPQRQQPEEAQTRQQQEMQQRQQRETQRQQEQIQRRQQEETQIRQQQEMQQRQQRETQRQQEQIQRRQPEEAQIRQQQEMQQRQQRETQRQQEQIQRRQQEEAQIRQQQEIQRQQQEQIQRRQQEETQIRQQQEMQQRQQRETQRQQQEMQQRQQQEQAQRRQQEIQQQQQQQQQQQGRQRRQQKAPQESEEEKR